MTSQERRRYPRYDMDVKIDFHVTFDITTKIDYQIRMPDRKELLPEKYSGISKNISVEGLGFQTDRKLNKGDLLVLNVYAPNVLESVRMEGVVCWCAPLKEEGQNPSSYEAGVRISVVEGEPVEKTIVLDQIHDVLWSNVLEAVFSSFKESMLRRKGLPPTV